MTTAFWISQWSMQAKAALHRNKQTNLCSAPRARMRCLRLGTFSPLAFCFGCNGFGPEFTLKHGFSRCAYCGHFGKTN
jgi:hypothetical protein